MRIPTPKGRALYNRPIRFIEVGGAVQIDSDQ